jgi:integrase
MPRLSDNVVKLLSCPPDKKDVLVFDANLEGFGVRVTAKGLRTFLFQYRAGGSVRRLPIGTFGSELTTTQARAKAEGLRGLVRDGRDPFVERKAAAAEIAAAETAARLAATEQAFTFARLVDTWDRKHLAGMRDSYRHDALGRIRLHLGALLDLPAAAVTRAQAVRELDRIAVDAGETTARRVMGYARSAYGWALKRGEVDRNPFADLPPMGREVRRDRVLTEAELGAIWNAAESLGPIHGGFARFLMLTLARRDEVARMTWDEVAADLSTWTLPGERAKNNRKHVVHLAGPARAILAALPRSRASSLVFATVDGKGLSVFSYIARVLTKRSNTTAWRLHDFRRAGVTALAGMGFAPHVADKLLNHVSGTINGVAAIYQRAEFMNERRAALDAWAAYVFAAADGRPAESNVIQWPGAAAG